MEVLCDLGEYGGAIVQNLRRGLASGFQILIRFFQSLFRMRYNLSSFTKH